MSLSFRAKTNSVGPKSICFFLFSAALALTLGVSTSTTPRADASPTAPTFNVNVTFDDVARTPYDDGVCNVPIYTGPCTLRAAIIKANHYPGGGVTINIPAGTYTLTIAPAGGDDELTGDLNISNTMTLIGNSAGNTIIDANQIDRVFNVAAGTKVTISNVTVRNGRVTDTGGGIVNRGALTLNHIAVSGNQTLSGSAGGGLANFGTLLLNNVVVNGNQSDGNAGGLYNDNFGTLTLKDSLISRNQTVSGGYGGGLSNSGALTLNNSLVSDNQASGKGGGIANFQGTMTQTNSTVSNNSALRDGGGIYNNAILNADATTIAGNLADYTASGTGDGGGIFNIFGTVNLRATLLGQNYVGPNAGDCSGPLNVQGYDLIESAPVSCTLNLSGPGNLPATLSQLDSLRDNGGPTPTRALFAGSPAIDAIPVVNCTNPLGAPLTVDQRGFPRPSGSACDIGAYEGSIAPRLLDVNLIRNGDAEGSAGSPTAAIVGMPYWTGSAAIVPYGIAGGFPATTDPGPVNRGINFFAGGYTSYAQVSQLISVTTLGPAIDAGHIKYDLSGYFGGYANQDDHANLSALFYNTANGTGAPIGFSPTIGDVMAADRGNQTGLLFSSASGVLPSGTRSIRVFLSMINAGSVGTYDDGYADNLSLVLSGYRVYLPLLLR